MKLFVFFCVNLSYQELDCSNLVKLPLSVSSINCICSGDKVTSKVKVHSVRVPGLPIRWRHSRSDFRCCALLLCHSGQIQNSFIFTCSLLKRHCHNQWLQANTEPFPNDIVETGNWAGETGNGVITFLVPAIFSFQTKRSKFESTF